MTEKHGLSPEFENVGDLLKYVNANKDKINPPKSPKKSNGRDEKEIIKKIESIEDAGEEVARNRINFLVNIHEENDPSNYTFNEFKQILKNFPKLREEMIAKIEDKIEEEKNPNKVKSLWELKNKISKK